jgi:predicted GIY-YIG superfamily endonuclease
MAYVYVIGGTEKPYKIGITNNPERRLKNLQTGHPFELKIHYKEEIPESQVRLIEQTIHKTIKYKQTHGEWFDISLEEAISEVKFARIRYLKDEVV